MYEAKRIEECTGPKILTETGLYNSKSVEKAEVCKGRNITPDVIRGEISGKPDCGIAGSRQDTTERKYRGARAEVRLNTFVECRDLHLS
jgi:hypothetical protein